MTAETEIMPRRSALAAARAWQAVELAPELRRGVEAAARASGVDPEAWLTRVVLEAASAARTTAEPAEPLQEPGTEVARSLAMLLSAARARSRERQAEASPLTLAEPAPVETLARPEPPAPEIRLTAVRPDIEPDPARQLPTLYLAPPQPRRHMLALGLLVVTVAAAFGAGAFYIRYGGALPALQPALTATLPTSPPAPKPDGAAAVAAPATAVPATPAPAASAPAPTIPGPATTASAPPAPTAPVPEPSTAVAAIPAIPPPPSTAPPAPATPTPPAAEPTAAAPPAPNPTSAPVPAADARSTAAPDTQPPPPAATTAAALPPGVGPRTQPPSQPAEVVISDYNLGVRYAFGTGVKQDYKKAAELFLKAAMQGLPDAQYNLGALYDNGLGVPKDPVRAVIWYHSAAEQNHPSAQLNLGLAYANGTGVGQDYAEAARWFRRAADQGVVTAQYNLAALYANGRGVDQSLTDAFAWFNIAAASGDLEARDQMKRAADMMSAQQLKAARALAMKLAEGVKRPVSAGTLQNAATTAAAATAGKNASAEPTTTAPAAGAAQSALAQPIDKAQVAEIQRYLARLQFDPGPASGVLTDKTTDAIRQYQTARKLAVDGDANRALLFRLKAEVERLQKP